MSRSDITYKTQVNATEPEGWREVRASGFQDAAIKALRCSKPLPDFPCTVYVGDPRPKLQHDNQTPMIVHAFRIERAKEVA